MFETGEFTLHSGGHSIFKVECDDLTDDDIATFAELSRRIVGPFKAVHGVPRGGLRLAEALEPHVDPESSLILCVDDVWTTGTSLMREMCKYRSGIGVKGLVLFDRGWVRRPKAVDAIWTLDHRLCRV